MPPTRPAFPAAATIGDTQPARRRGSPEVALAPAAPAAKLRPIVVIDRRAEAVAARAARAGVGIASTGE